jgi:hypothetical protein
MSTQRRENRWQRSSCTDVARRTSRIWLHFIALFARAIATLPPQRLTPVAGDPATVGTAPLNAAFSRSAWLATNSLQSDHLSAQLVRFLRLVRLVEYQHIRRSGSPPLTDAFRPADARSSLPITPTPSVLDHFHPSLPFRGSTGSLLNRRPAHTPAGQCRWTERYDGKRNLYFQYAA